MSVTIQQQDFELAAELADLRSSGRGAGALVSFVGLVRDFAGVQKIDSLYLQHYPGMSEKALHKIVTQAQARWNLLGVRVIHRVGVLEADEQIVMVATAASHRAEAFSACEFIIDYLKTDAPFWKREQTVRGAHWLETRSADSLRTARWNCAMAGEQS